MSEKILVPVLGESITEATVSKWLKNEGDTVEADEPIIELETDKVNLEVPSPVSGVLTKINSKDGSVVEVGALLGTVSVNGSSVSKTEEIKKIKPKTEKNNVINLEAQKNEPEFFDKKEEEMNVQGRDLLTGKPKQVQITHREIAKALDKSILRIEDSVMETLSQTPPELAADIYNTGIYLAGGGSMLRGLDKRLSQKTDLPVYIAEDPLRAVVRGTGIVLKNLAKYKSVLIK